MRVEKGRFRAVGKGLARRPILGYSAHMYGAIGNHGSSPIIFSVSEVKKRLGID